MTTDDDFDAAMRFEAVPKRFAAVSALQPSFLKPEESNCKTCVASAKIVPSSSGEDVIPELNTRYDASINC